MVVFAGEYLTALSMILRMLLISLSGWPETERFFTRDDLTVIFFGRAKLAAISLRSSRIFERLKVFRLILKLSAWLQAKSNMLFNVRDMLFASIAVSFKTFWYSFGG